MTSIKKKKYYFDNTTCGLAAIGEKIYIKNSIVMNLKKIIFFQKFVKKMKKEKAAYSSKKSAYNGGNMSG